MITNIKDKKTMESIVRVWHSKRAQTNFLLPEEVYLKAAAEKKCSVYRFEGGCYLFFQQEHHIDFYFFLEKGTAPVEVPPVSLPLVMEQVCLEKKGQEPKASLWEKVGFRPYLERKRLVMPIVEGVSGGRNIVYAEAAHADQILQMMEESFEPYTSALPERKELLESIARHEVLAEIRDGRLVGFLRFGWEKKNCVLWQIAVLASEKGKGIGKKLVRDWVWLVSPEALRCQLWVRTDNPAAMRMYEKTGFLPDGRIAPVMIKEKG